jgi:3-oxoacyl-[acyl-carrier protein] reductase
MNGQVALVTGSSRGIGLAAALELARAGFDVALNSRSEGDELDEAADRMQAPKASRFASAFNVADISAHDAILDRVEKELGPLTTLVNNAGVGVISRGDVLDVTEESYDRCLDVNTKSMFFLCRKRSPGA